VTFKAALSLGLVVLLPLTSYLVVKKVGETAVNMPLRYFPDTVINMVKDGKLQSDTVWHTTKNLTLRNQLNHTVSLDSLKGKLLVINLFFARCPIICPKLMANMAKLQQALRSEDVKKKIDTSFVHFLSLTVDPLNDTPSVLRAYGNKFGADPSVWWLLTGDKKTIYDYAFEELKIGLADSSTQISPDFIHSEHFVLLDKNRVVRGYYKGNDKNAMLKLSKDLVLGSLEKDKKKKGGFLANNAPLLATLAISSIFIVGLFALYGKTKKVGI
jgi:protein SCO1